ncbi:regulation of nuclear pre-mRNA domain-containing protein 1A [Diaphorina citri]|uniref:Regulation of nuclear pre-mRNA domain-containing protein 1A n=1 Tax=Diaphorina citri TaxID=121845 RepID=A0A1S3DS15_DIACI|nr:regulation of nuclear pre-mRNA domain-containing protein 1A [Diaphorina citri]
MAGFTQSALISKLEELNASQQSIQTLSLWLIHHRKHHSTIVKTWIDEVEKADDHRKLTLMYLANDVIQNSKKKGPEYGKEFGHVLKQAFVSVGDVHCSEKTRSSLSRILNIWEERGVYDKQQIASFRTAFNAALEPQTKRRKLSESNTEVLYDVDAFVSVGDVHCSEKTRSSLSRILNIWEERGVYDKQQIASFRTAFNAALEPQTKRRKLSESNTEVLYDVDGITERHIKLSPKPELRECPETQELIKVLLELETSASSDANIREKIAKLPPEVSEIQLLSKVQDRVAAENLSIQVNEAVDLLTNYNTRLVTEMEDRKRASAMLKDYIAAQRELLEQAEQRLEECQSNLEQVCKVREELQSLAHLPMPEKPLPAAGDLFKIRNHQTNSSGGKHQHNSHSKNKKSSRSSS